MGKLLTFMLMIIFVDLILIVLGLVSGTFDSLLFGSIADIISGNFTLGGLWSQLTGNLGTLAVAASLLGIVGLAIAGISTGFFLSVTDTKLFIPMAVALCLVISQDFISFGVTLREMGVSPIITSFIVIPLCISTLIIAIEFARGRD